MMMRVQNPAVQPEPVQHICHSRSLVLLVENHPTISELLVTTLRFAGQTAICFNNVAALIRLTQVQPMLLAASLIVVDISQPLASVETVVEPLLAQWHSRRMTPPGIIILTTYPPLQQAAQISGYRALLKPFHLRDFLASTQT
jgi:CheY-like chemotaxis protein